MLGPSGRGLGVEDICLWLDGTLTALPDYPRLPGSAALHLPSCSWPAQTQGSPPADSSSWSSLGPWGEDEEWTDKARRVIMERIGLATAG